MNNKEYFTHENAANYYSNSQIKELLTCEAAAMANIRGEYKRERSTAMLVGSYVDSYFEGTLKDFKEHNKEIFTAKGELKAEFKQAETIIQVAEDDEYFMKFMNGEKQIVRTGNILGYEFRGKLDVLHENIIVDLKVMANFEPIWKDGRKQNFIDAWSYDLQLAIYQELEFIHSGKRKDCYIAALTKEKTTDKAIFFIPNEILSNALDLLAAKMPRIDSVKNHGETPIRCENCNFCKSTKRLNYPINYYEL